MRVNKKSVGDIYLNTLLSDIWILNKIWNNEEEKEVWTLNLVNDDCQELLKYVKGFKKIGNIYDLLEENQRLKNIIYTTLEYVDREEVSSAGTPFTSTSIGKEIKELLEGEKTFNSIWKENQRLNNVLNELEEGLQEAYKELQPNELINGRIFIENILKELKESDK